MPWSTPPQEAEAWPSEDPARAGVTSPLLIWVDTAGVSFLALNEHHRSLKASQRCGRVSRPVCCDRGGLSGQLWFCVGSIPSGQEGPPGSGCGQLSRDRWGSSPVKGRRAGWAGGSGLGPRAGREGGQGRREAPSSEIFRATQLGHTGLGGQRKAGLGTRCGQDSCCDGGGGSFRPQDHLPWGFPGVSVASLRAGAGKGPEESGVGVGMTFAPGGLTRPGLDGPPAWSVCPSGLGLGEASATAEAEGCCSGWARVGRLSLI